MAHFAKVENGIVTNVIVAEQEFIDTLPETETWIQTSYNTFGGVHYDPETNEPSADQSKALRLNYAGRGFIYDAELDAFYRPQPFDSWSLNTSTGLWEAPTAYPEDGNMYTWDEATTSWVAVE